MSKLIFSGGEGISRKILLLVASVALTVVLASGVALAALSNTPDSGTVGANGRVWDILRAGDKVYLAGSFTQITDKNGTSVPRNNLAAIDASTGRVTDWNPNVTKLSGTSTVHKMALSEDGSRLFVGGDFTRVGGLTRGRLAAIDPNTGALDSKWRADADNTIFALTVSGGRLYAGGAFKTVAGQPRECLAAVDQATGTLDSTWKPTASRDFDTLTANVRAMDVSGDGTRVYVGGFFSNINHVHTRKLAAVDAVTGKLVTGFKPDDPNTIFAMDVADGRVYIGTEDLLEGVEAFDANTGQLLWSVAGGHPHPQAGDVQAIVASGGKVYAGGHFGQMGGLVRKRLVEVDAQTGQIGPWAPEIAGDTVSLGVWALEIDPTSGHLYAGGDFTQIEGAEYRRFAQFSVQPDCTISGTSADDVLTGTAAADVICGRGGNDIVKGLGGNDILTGGSGWDKLYGGEGDDRLEGGIGMDLASYNSSTAPVSASLGSSTNSATGEGADTFASIENLQGSSKDDTLTGSAADNAITGGGGNDKVVGGAGADTLKGEDGADTIDSKDGVSGNDSLDGGAGTDTAVTDATEKSIVGFP
jgi:Ca2+-binding RTX toxin-like protein